MAAKDTNPKTAYGQAKPPLGLVPGVAMVQLAEAFRDGADKYGAANWRTDAVSSSTYFNAALRHLIAWNDGEECDKVSGVSHLAHAGANLCILMDAMACGKLVDDRPPVAPTGDVIRALTRPIVEKPAPAPVAYMMRDKFFRAYPQWAVVIGDPTWPRLGCGCPACRDWRLFTSAEGGQRG
jgi:hypothetical protein